jgi:multidrug efflux pump subunit AcrA (membrane-fusion protein)
VVEGNDSLVFVQESPGHFRRRPIQPGPEIDNNIVVSSGLKAGELVAAHGALLLDEMGKAK